MSRTVILVVDGFGIGAMPDAGALDTAALGGGRRRPGDRTADTLGHLLDHCRAALSTGTFPDVWKTCRPSRSSASPVRCALWHRSPG